MKSGFLCLLFFLIMGSAHASPSVVIVIADGLTLADISQPDLPRVALLRQTGVTALMSSGLPVGNDPAANVYASLGAGDAIHMEDMAQGLLGRSLAAAHIHTALIGDADGDDTGVYSPAQNLLPLPDFVLPDGAVKDGTVPGGKRIQPTVLWQQTQNALRLAPLVVVHDGDFLRLSREENQHLLTSPVSFSHKQRALRRLDIFLGLRAQGQTMPAVFLLCPPAPNENGKWDSLTPAVWSDGLRHLPALGSTDTTQTVGLIAARDVAPTILNYFHVPPAIQMTGAPLVSAAGCNVTLLTRLDRVTRLNQQAQNPFFWFLGFGAAGVLFLSVASIVTGWAARSHRVRNTQRYGLRTLSAWPLALLIVPIFVPQSLFLYLTMIAVLTFILALLPTPTTIFSFTALVLIVDAFTGTHLVAQSVLSAYALSGIRFYGIGNEYMGIFLGGTLLLAAVLRTERSLLILFALTTFALSFPAFGAKAGGAVTSLVTFVAAWRTLARKRVTLGYVAGAVVAGFILVFIWAALQRVLPDARRTHLDTATEAFIRGRFGYIAGVAVRKTGLAAHVLLHPGTLLGLLGLALLGAAFVGLLRVPIEAYLERHPRFAAVWHASGWGLGACILFNDSGIVAAILLSACLLLSLLHGLTEQAKEVSCDLSRWTSGRFGLGWRSAMRWRPLHSR